jgi:hypothetical protein
MIIEVETEEEGERKGEWKRAAEQREQAGGSIKSCSVKKYSS